MPQAPRPVITGLGFVTPIGTSRETVEDGLRQGRHGLSPVQFLGNPAIPVRLAGQVAGFDVSSQNYRDWQWPSEYTIERETLRTLAPHGVFALCALDQALREAGLRESVRGDDTTALFCASSGSAMLLHHNLAQMYAVRGERGNPLGVVSSIAGTLNFTLAAHFGVTGAVCGFVSACASSSHALGYACDEIRLGRMRRVLVVGAEEHNAETILPFAAMRALSLESDPLKASCPFDKGRSGFVGSGGAVALVLEDEAEADRRGARIQARLLGWGQSADGHSVSMSLPDGSGLRRAMERALANAGIEPRAVDYVNAHATSTPVGDAAEAAALKAVFGTSGARPVVSSTKGLTGHPLSMSGVMEAAFCVLALEGAFMPGNAHLRDPDPACDGLILPVETLNRRPSVVLNNSCGFGGSNVCHLLGKGE